MVDMIPITGGASDDFNIQSHIAGRSFGMAQ